MPNWNLRDDWPDEYKSLDSLGWPRELFSMSIPENVEVASCSIENENVNNIKKLVINVTSQSDVDVLAIVPGGMELNNTTGIGILTTELFSTAFLYAIEQPRQYPVPWFKNWLNAGRIPRKIIYENIINYETTEGMCFSVNAGDHIGKMGINLNNLSEKQIKISIEYADSTNDNPKFMHPVEFFSLLFWREECDPVFNANPSCYQHQLLQRMMSSVSDDKNGDFHNDNWLGLRPPLRTFTRVKWEAFKEHLVLDDDYPNHWVGDTSNVYDRIKNPFIHKTGGYVGQNLTKCNIFAGEMLFRSGFRAPVTMGNMGGCTPGSFPYKIKYQSVSGLFASFGIPGAISQPMGRIRYVGEMDCNHDQRCISGDATHEFAHLYARRVEWNQNLTNNIQNLGRVYLLAKTGPSGNHVVIVDEFTNNNPYSGDANTVNAMDQHASLNNNSWSRTNYRYLYPNNNNVNVVILEFFPGGDPSEEWGKIDLNCLEVISQNG